MRFSDLRAGPLPRVSKWALVYSTVEQEALERAAALAARSKGSLVFGCTSSSGVFVPSGFERGAFALLGDEQDARVEAQLVKANAVQARRAAREAVQQLTSALGQRPDTLLLHATPGFEERILEGVDEAFVGRPPPLYGGSAADDDLSGKWRVFLGESSHQEGFLLVGFASPSPLLGAFVAGYVAGNKRATVTRASGRVVAELDGKPAAEVYNAWREGALDAAVASPRTILADTTLHPLGRVVDRVGSVPRYLLAHPHEVRPDKGLSFFTDLAVGDELSMMVGSEGGLLERTEQVVQRALGAGRSKKSVRGGILVYCGGCVMAIGKRAADVGRLYSQALGGAPFVGAATFGEQGCFSGPTPTNRHGNLMCDTVLFTE